LGLFNIPDFDLRQTYLPHDSVTKMLQYKEQIEESQIFVVNRAKNWRV